MAMVEIAKVRAINRVARENASGNGREQMTRIRDRIGVRLMERNNLVATSGVREDAKGSAHLIRQFSDAVVFGITLNLDADEDKVTRGELGSRTAVVDAVLVGFLAAVGNNEGDDLTGEINVRSSLANVGEDRGASIRHRRGSGSRGGSIEGQVERKFKLASHGGNTMNNVRTVNGAAIPGVGSNHGSFNPDKMSASIGTGDGDGFV
jgi:hypothetical protein